MPLLNCDKIKITRDYIPRIKKIPFLLTGVLNQNNTYPFIVNFKVRAF
jgi:hypothetical protein